MVIFNKKEKKPNIVFILTDDQGAWALGCAGNKEIYTPNLDHLAEEGIRFENFFCTSPVCSPARASLLTGSIPSQHGIHDWILDGNGPDEVTIMGKPGITIEYLADIKGYTDWLAEAGYKCGISGKWHIGASRIPQKHFSHWLVFEKSSSRYFNPKMIKDGKETIIEGYLTDIITDDSLQFIDQHAEEDNPFYISVHYNAPHTPWVNNHPKEYYDLYNDCPFNTFPQEPIHEWSKANGLDMDNADPIECFKWYYAAVTGMDRNVGRILDRLNSLGIRQNTLVCFMSDNGFNCGHHGIWGKGNGTFPQNMYDTSVKVPAIFSLPGTIPCRAVSDALISQYDVMPTLLEFASIENPESEKLPGKSFMSILLGEKDYKRDNIVVFDEYGPVRMIRTHEWKYVHRYPYGPHELYNLVNDPGERKNLVNELELKERVAEMKKGLEKWFAKYVNPEIDGRVEPVLGNGQIGFPGLKSGGKQAFYDKSNRSFRLINAQKEG